MNRRRTQRITTSRPAKVLETLTGRYRGAQTVDLSEGGALLEFTQPVPCRVGDRVEVGIASSSRSVMISSDALQRARVVRILAGIEGSVIAVEFDRAVAPAAAVAAA